MNRGNVPSERDFVGALLLADGPVFGHPLACALRALFHVAFMELAKMPLHAACRTVVEGNTTVAPAARDGEHAGRRVQVRSCRRLPGIWRITAVAKAVKLCLDRTAGRIVVSLELRQTVAGRT